MTLNLLSMTMKLKDGRWTAICSDDQTDLAGDRATVQLFKNFIKRAQETGKYPYLSVAHYFATEVPIHLKSVLGEHGVAGWADTLVIDNGKLVASGTFEPSELGQKTMMAIAQGGSPETRVSIGFTDLEHKHGPIRFVRKSWDEKCPLCVQGRTRQFVDGEWVHAAVTRVPVNPRSDIKLEEKSMAAAIASIQEDASSIVGDELTAALEEAKPKEPELKSVVAKSEGASIDLDALRILIREEIERSQPPVEPAPVGELDSFVADLSAKLKSVTAMNQVEEALGTFNDNVRGHVQKSLPPVAPAAVDLSPVMAQLTALTEGLAAVNQQVAAVTAVVNRSQATPNIGVPPARMPIIVENPAATPSNGLPAENQNSPRAIARRSVGLGG